MERCADRSDLAGGTEQGMDGLKSVMYQNKSSVDKAILLRPHHGMCLAYFIGKGYSEGFSAHMERMLEILEKDVSVRLTVSADRICEACPNNRDGICVSQEKVERYDRGVLVACHLKDGQELSFLNFAASVQKHIIRTGKRREICGGCQWSEICDNQESRWENLKM